MPDTITPAQPTSPTGIPSAAQPASPAAPGNTTPTAPAAAAAPVAAPAAAGTTPAKPADGKTETKPGEAAPKADDIELKFADGVALDEAVLTSFKAAAKEIGLDSAKAQKLADAYTAATKTRNDAFEQQLAAQQAQWKGELQADKEIGGAQLAANQALAAKAMDRFGGPNLRKILAQTGLGDHPDFVRAFVRAGKAIAEDSVSGTAGAAGGTKGGPEELHRTLYPTMFPKT